MKDGKFTYYTIQCKRVAESPWLKPKEPLVPIKDKEWAFASFDHFSFDPHKWEKTESGGVDWKALCQEASDELHDVWSKTGNHGWWNLKYAIAALKKVRKDDANGKYDTRSTYGEHCAAIRHKFRIVKQTVYQKTEIIHLHKDVLKAI